MVCRLTSVCAVACALWICAGEARSQHLEAGPGEFSLDSLLNIEVSAAAKYSQHVSEAAASVTIITSEDIHRYGYRTLGEALAAQRGFYATNDRNYTYIGVRGFSRPTDYNDRILLLLNGHSLNENVYGSALMGTELPLNLDHVSRIEIIRGPGSVLYGTNAMFAVVNIVTQDGNTVDGATVAAEGGSCGRIGSSVEFGRRIGDDLDISGSAHWLDVGGTRQYFQEYDDLATNNGWSSSRDWDRAFGVDASARYHDLQLRGMATSRQKGIPTGSYETDFNDPDARTTDERRFLELRYESRRDRPMAATVRAYYDDYYYKGRWPYETEEYDESHGRWVGTEGQMRWDTSPSNRAVAGAEFQSHTRASYALWGVDTVYLDGDFPFSARALYVQDEWQPAEALAVTTGVRYDEHSGIQSSVTPRCAVLLYPRDLGTVKLLYGEAFRVPSIWEREVNNGLGLMLNPDLQPERIRTYELAWERRVGRNLWTALSLYQYKVSDLIDLSFDTLASDYIFANVGRATARGFEAEVDARDIGGIDGSLSYTFQDATNPDDGTVLTNSPKHLVKLGVSVPIGRHVRASWRQVFESWRKTVYDTRTGPYTLTSLTFIVRPRSWVRSATRSILGHFDLSLTIDNLFDAEYQTPGGTEHRQAGIPQDGRNVLFRVRIRT